MKRLVSLLLVLIMLLSISSLTTLAEEEDNFVIANVEILSDHVALVNFNDVMADDFYDFMSQAPNYFDKWIRITGGVEGEADAALNGNLVDGAKTYPLENHQAFELFLAEGIAFVPGREYTIAFDLSTYTAKKDGTDQSIAAFAKSVDGKVISTEPVSFGASEIAGTPELMIQGIAAQDTSSVDVLFNQRAISGMPLRSNAATNLGMKAVPADGGYAVPVVYVDPVEGTNGREFVLYFAEPLNASAEYTLSFAESMNLTGAVSKVGELNQQFVMSPDTLDYSLVSAVLEKEGARESLILTVDHPIESFRKEDGSYELLKETPVVGAVGNVLTAGDVLGLFDFGGVKAADGRELADALEDVAGYFADSKTIVVHNDNLFSFALENASVALKEGALKNCSTVLNMAGQPIAINTGNVSAATAEYLPDEADYLKLSTSNIVYRTFDYYVDQYDDPNSTLDNFTPGHHQPVDGIDPRLQIVTRSNYKQEDIVEQHFSTYVVENKYIKATFLPEFGGRMLSLIYKPTGNDLLYLNPVGTPYGMSFNDTQDPTTYPTISNCSFYSNWLMVWGGVFPTIGTAEHGKYWYLPFDYEVKEESDKIVIAMQVEDDIDYLTTNPARFSPDHTNLIWNVNYVVYKDKPYVDMEVSISNPTGNGDRIFEHWTCTTLAPGADTYDGSPTMEIVAPTQILYRDGYSWMANVEAEAFPAGTPDSELPQYVKDNLGNNGIAYPYTQSSYMIYDKLSSFRNWSSSGIAYPMDMARLPQADWWGVINEENQEGILHLSDNSITPGLKYWLWAYNGSFDTMPYAPTSGSSRPYIELWCGASNRFFNNRYIKDGETISWTETFMPTAGLSNVTNASKEGAVEIKFAQQGNGFIPYADVFSTEIGKELTAVLKSDDQILAEKNFVAEALSKITLTADQPVAAGTTVTVDVYAGNELLFTTFATEGTLPTPEKVAVEDFTINETEKVIGVGESFDLFGIIAPFYADTSTVKYHSSNTDVAKVEPYSYVRPESSEAATTNMITKQVVTGKQAGTATITVVVDDPISGKTFTQTCNVTVTAPISRLSFRTTNYLVRLSGSPLNLAENMTVSPALSVASTPVAWTSSNPAVATVDENGMVTPVANGETIITVSAGEFSAEVTIVVAK